jgi:hypothetical protein
LQTIHQRSVSQKRTRISTMLAFIHATLTLFFVFGIVNLSVVISQEKDDPDAVRGMLIGMAACGVFAFVSVVTAVGLWIQTRWAWGLAVASVATMAVGCAIGFYGGGDWEWDVFPWAVVFSALLVLHLAPAIATKLKAKDVGRKDSVEVL